MTPGQTPYADGQFVGDPIDRPPQDSNQRRSGPDPTERCPGTGLMAMVDPHPDSPGELLICCPICQVVVAPVMGVFGPVTPRHDRELARG